MEANIFLQNAPIVEQRGKLGLMIGSEGKIHVGIATYSHEN